MNDRYSELAQTLIDKFAVPAEEISPHATLADLGLDSLAVAELFLNLQENWGVRLEDDADSGYLTLEQLLEVAGSRM